MRRTPLVNVSMKCALHLLNFQIVIAEANKKMVWYISSQGECWWIHRIGHKYLHLDLIKASEIHSRFSHCEKVTVLEAIAIINVRVMHVMNRCYDGTHCLVGKKCAQITFLWFQSICKCKLCDTWAIIILGESWFAVVAIPTIIHVANCCETQVEYQLKTLFSLGFMGYATW